MSGAILPRRISFDKVGVGRTIKDSKQKATWKFTLDGDKGEQHEVILVYTFSTKKAELLVDRQSIHMSQLGEADLASRTNAVGEILQNAALGNTLFSHVFYINDVEIHVRVDAPSVTSKDPFQITIDGRDWDKLHARDTFSVKMEANTEIHLGSGRRKSTRGRTSSGASMAAAAAPTAAASDDLLFAETSPSETRSSKSNSFDPFTEDASVSASDGFDAAAAFPPAEAAGASDGFDAAAAFPPATASAPVAANGLGSVFNAPPPQPAVVRTQQAPPAAVAVDPFFAPPSAATAPSPSPSSGFSSGFPAATAGDLTTLLSPSSGGPSGAAVVSPPQQRGSLTASDLSNLYASSGGGNSGSNISGMVPGAQAPPSFLQTAPRSPATFPMASPSTNRSRTSSTSTVPSPGSSGGGDGSLVDLGALSINENPKKSEPSPQRGSTGSTMSSQGGSHMWSNINPPPKPPQGGLPGGSPQMGMGMGNKGMNGMPSPSSYTQYQQQQQQQPQQGKDAFEGLLKF